MINLVRNELTKVFHKKGIYILGVICILFMMLNVFIYKVSYSEIIEDSYSDFLMDDINNYDLSDPDELEWYVTDKTLVDTEKVAEKFDKGSWQRTMVYDEIEPLVSCMNRAKYVDKDDLQYNSCKEEFDIILHDINTKDWKDFVKEEKDELNNKIDNLNEYLKMVESSSLRKSVLKDIEKIKYQIEGLDIRLDKNIAPDDSYLSTNVDTYVEFAMMYVDYDKNEDNYTDNEKLREKRQIESTMEISKYVVLNNMETGNYDDAKEIIKSEYSVVILFVVIAIIMISGSIMSDEYNKGTIKQLLIKPYSRSKILLSKYITSFIVFGLFMVFYGILCYIGYGFVGSFSDYSSNVIVYDYVSRSVIEMSLFKYCLVQVLAQLPQYLIIMCVSLFASTVIGNTAVSMIISVLTYFGGNIINLLIVGRNIKYLSWFPTVCWNLTEFLYGGIPAYEYANFTLSVVVSVVTILLLVISTFLIFRRKDIKNI